MTKEQQDLAWACLPKEARDQIREYQMFNSASGHTKELLDIVFGYNNILSQALSEEMLIVERKKVQEVLDMHERAGNKITVMVIKALFGDKCLPDKEEKPEYKFKINDRVRIINSRCKTTLGKIGTVVELPVPEEDFPYYKISLNEQTYCNMEEENLEPYTESETKDMEELNLCEILKGHEEETFYCPFYGIVELKYINENSIGFASTVSPTDVFSVNEKGFLKFNEVQTNLECVVFPFKAQRDWIKWDKENNHKTPKTWSELKKGKGGCRITRCGAEITSYCGNNVYDATKYNTPIEKSALALLKIHQLIEVGYGGNVSKEEWKFTDNLCPVCHIGYHHSNNEFFIGRNLGSQHSPILFHTEKQAKEFLSYPENVQLLKDYFMIDEPD